MNLGKYQCDDGNNINGDGCSSDCIIEMGYICNTLENKTDKCYKNDHLLAYLKVNPGNTLRLYFSDVVTCSLSSNLFLNIRH